MTVSTNSMPTVIETVTPLKAGNLAAQRKHSNYNYKGALSKYSEALYKLVFDSDLPNRVRVIFDYARNNAKTNGIGSFYSSYETISDWAKENGYTRMSPRTIERGFAQIKKECPQLLTRISTKKKNGARGQDLKIVADFQTIMAYVKESQMADEVAVRVAEGFNESIPCGSKDEQPILEEHKELLLSSNIKTNIKDKRINRIRESESLPFPQKKYGIKKEVKEILHQDILVGLSDEQRQQYANKIQMALKVTKTNIKEPECQKAVLDICCTFVMTYEKEPDKLKDQTEDGYYKTLYVCLTNGLYDYRMHKPEEPQPDVPLIPWDLESMDEIIEQEGPQEVHSSEPIFEPEKYDYDEEGLPIFKDEERRWIQEPKPEPIRETNLFLNDDGRVCFKDMTGALVELHPPQPREEGMPF